MRLLLRFGSGIRPSDLQRDRILPLRRYLISRELISDELSGGGQPLSRGIEIAPSGIGRPKTSVPKTRPVSAVAKLPSR